MDQVTPSSLTQDIARLLEAAQFAARQHRHQKRRNAEQEPYINHPIDVAWRIWQSGATSDVNVAVAALLHDVVEDTATSAAEIEAQFGHAVAAMVAEVSDDKSLPKTERRQRQVVAAPSLSTGAKLIRLADKASNVSAIASSPPVGWGDERCREYLDWTEAVVAGVRGVSAKLERQYDEALARARAQFGSLKQP